MLVVFAVSRGSMTGYALSKGYGMPAAASNILFRVYRPPISARILSVEYVRQFSEAGILARQTGIGTLSG